MEASQPEANTDARVAAEVITTRRTVEDAVMDTKVRVIADTRYILQLNLGDVRLRIAEMVRSQAMPCPQGGIHLHRQHERAQRDFASFLR